MVGLLVCSTFVAGCTGALEFTVDPRANLNAYPLQIQEGETVTFDARDSEPIEGVITEYLWTLATVKLLKQLLALHRTDIRPLGCLLSN